MNPVETTGKTALQCAAWREVDSLPVFQVLIEAGAEVTMTHTANGASSPVLDTALNVFTNENANARVRKKKEGAGLFIESESVHEVLTTSPGAIIRWLLRSHTELQADAEGFSLLLQMAAADGDAEFVRLLIERNVDLGVEDHYFGTALHAAGRFGHLECVKVLVEAGADIGMAAGRYGNTPLRAAVEGQHVAIVRYLLDAGVDMHSIDYSTDRTTPWGPIRDSTLTTACSSGNIELVHLLLQSTKSHGRPAHFNSLASALHSACFQGHSEVVELLLEDGADPEEKSINSPFSFDSPSSLVNAARAGHLRVMELLLAAGGVLYDNERSINVLKELVTGGSQKEAINCVLTQLLGTDNFIPACKECPAFMRNWQEDAGFVLMVDAMPKYRLILTHIAALGAQRSVDLLLEDDFTIINTNSTGLQTLQAAAYFQRYGLLLRLLSRYPDQDFVRLGCDSLICMALDGLMPSKSAIDAGSCCEFRNSRHLVYPFVHQDLNESCPCRSAELLQVRPLYSLCR